MIDFEDRAPAPPLSIGERLLAGLCGIISIYGLATSFAQLGAWLYSLTVAAHAALEQGSLLQASAFQIT